LTTATIRYNIFNRYIPNYVENSSLRKGVEIYCLVSFYFYKEEIMKKLKIVSMSTIIGILLLFATAAFAGGYPFAVLDTSTSTKIVVVGKFSTQFTQQEAQNASAAVISLVQENLGSSGTTAMYTPNELASFGVGDADYLKSLVKDNYVAAGFDLYVFVDIKRVAEYVPGFGGNVRIDLFIADMAAALGISADYLYALSIEAPELYASLFSAL